jgi:hypothetical protein
VKTTILCTKTHRRHTVTFNRDGTIVSSGPEGCGGMDSNAARVAAMLQLGGHPNTDGCVGLVALQRYGIPSILNGMPNDEGYMGLGKWRDLYVRYETNKVIEKTMDDVRRRRDAAHADTFRFARKALRSCKSYGRRFVGDMAQVAQFMPEQSMADGRLIAITTDDIWTVPLQKEWVEEVHAAGIANVSNRFVCGISEDGQFVWAVADGNDDDKRIVVKKYGLQTKPETKLVRL